MDISSFDDLLRAARQQPEPQRLLFVFAKAGLENEATPEQRERFRAGEGGTLTPVACVDKAPADVATFAALVDESREFAAEWTIVFVAALSGRGGRAPTSEAAEAHLQRMVESIKLGSVGQFIPFDREGRAVLLEG